jgi:hypothetical protein
MHWQLWVALAGSAVLIFFVMARRAAHRQPTITGSGLNGVGRILSLEQTGEHSETAQGCKIGLRVEIPGHPPYDVTVRRLVQLIHIPRVQPGATIPIQVDPADPQKIRIDFDQPIAPPQA